MVKKIIVLYFYVCISLSCKSPYNIPKVWSKSKEQTIPGPDPPVPDSDDNGVDSSSIHDPEEYSDDSTKDFFQDPETNFQKLWPKSEEPTILEPEPIVPDPDQNSVGSTKAFFHDPDEYGLDSDGYPICLDDSRESVWKHEKDLGFQWIDGERQYIRGKKIPVSPKPPSAPDARVEPKLKSDPAKEIQKLFDELLHREDTEDATTPFCKVNYFSSKNGEEQTLRYCGGHVLGQRKDKPGPWEGFQLEECATVCYLTHRKESGYPPDLPKCQSFHFREEQMQCDFRDKAPGAGETPTDWNIDGATVKIPNGIQFLKFIRPTVRFIRLVDTECTQMKILTPKRLQKMIEERQGFKCSLKDGAPLSDREQVWRSKKAFKGKNIYDGTDFSEAIPKHVENGLLVDMQRNIRGQIFDLLD